MKLIQALAVLVCMLTGVAANAQVRQIRGKVTDSLKQPIPFTTVIIKGSKTGTSSDAEGNFSIKANEGQTLLISGTGIAPQEVRIGTESYYNVQVSRRSTNLSEVVVTTALGIRRSRNSLPYAAQQITGDDLTKTVTTNAVDNLSGKVAGLEITSSNAMGGSTNVVLRGFKSLTQSNQALFIVDGVPYDNSSYTGSGYDFGSAAADLNPDDIASLSVLKGAAASALYGSRGSNGVIIVTTKRGLARKGLGVTASFGVSVGSLDPSTLPVYQTQNGEGYGADGYNTPNNPNYGFYYQSIPGINGGNPVLIPATNDDAATGPAYDPKLMVYNWDAFSPSDPNFHKATPWQPAAHHNPTDYFVTPLTTTENILVQGGGNAGTFKLAYTRDDQKGYMPNSNIKKDLFDFGATFKASEKVTFDGGINFVNESATNRYLFQYTATTNPMTDFRQWWPTNVNIQAQKDDYFASGETNATWNWVPSDYAVNTANNIGLPAYHNNLYWTQYQNYENDSRQRYTGHAKLNVALTDYLNLSGSVSDDYYTQLVEQRFNIGSVEPSAYSRQNQSFNETNFNVLLNFNKNIGNSFNLKALVGGNVQKDNIPSIFANTNGGLILPGFWSLSNSLKAPNAPIESDLRKEINSVFGGVTLSYKDMITLDGTMRRDQSSTLPAANNTYYYPSVSANFVFSKLLPATAGWISYGKFWANYAQVGGDAPYYDVYNTYTINTPINGQPVMNGSTQNNNQFLVPENNKTYELGLEMEFLQNRVGFTADYYHSIQSNQILPISISTATGYAKFSVNGGSVQNQGVEATLRLTPVKTRSFTWNMIVNWSKNVNKVLSLYGGQPSFVIGAYQNSIQTVAEVGKSYGIIRGTDYVYLHGQKEVDSTGHYIISPNPRSDIGSIAPDWIGGINNSFTYKNFTFSFLIDIHQGGDVYSLDMDYGSFSGLYPRTAGFNDLRNPVRSPLNQGGGIILNAVTANGKPNTTRIDESNLDFGAFSFGSEGNGEANRQFVYSASYIKLREAAITWSMPKRAMEKLSALQGIDFSLSGRNLWIIHKDLPYADPEQGQAAGNGSIGFQNGAYPTVRNVSFIVKVKF
ncbi:MAG TPA: SusC/RagA family TonB-linked outer membrane protein [Puia sp.]|jgi:TonB-linked SusC/RagA family outer membrane protein|nr:SusC/RagA family TonB-linked outer membrane protein [Puia sp.]